MLICNKCNQEKLETDFTNLKKKWCKTCVKEYNKIYREQNKDKYKKYKQTDKYKEKSKIYKQKTKQHIQEWGKEYYKNNKEKFSSYYEINKEKIIARTKKWSILNKKTLSDKFKEKYKSNPQTKLRLIVSGRIREFLKSVGKNKEGKSISKYLSYTMQDLKQHLESLFEPWMTWENHGVYNSKTWQDYDQSTWTWQIDHIIPQSKIPYSSIEDENFKKCWALENLRPYSAKENIIEGSNLARTYS